MNSKTLFHWPFLWTDEKEEAWLCDLSAQGWHLKQVQFPSLYTFEWGDSAEFVYRLDTPLSQVRFSQIDTMPPSDLAPFDESAYQQLFADAGWTYVGAKFSRRYFRQIAMPGYVQELYSSATDKIELLQRQLLCQTIMLCVVLLCMLYPLPQNPAPFIFWLIPRALVLLFVAYPLRSTWQRLRQLQLEM